MAILARLVTAVLLLLLLRGGAAAQTEQRVALVIGNSNYLSVVKLRNPANEATAMAAMLRHAGFEVIERENVSRREFIDAAQSFANKLAPGGVGLVFYAGHAIQAQGANYLVPVDANLASEDDLEYETLALRDLLNKTVEARVRLGMVILDACRDNPFILSRSSLSGLAAIDPPAGTLIAYATSPGKVTGDGDNGMFSAELLKAMSRPDNVLDVFGHVTEAVERQTGNAQTPWIAASFRGEFHFTPPTLLTTAPPPSPPSPTAALPDAVVSLAAPAASSTKPKSVAPASTDSQEPPLPTKQVPPAVAANPEPLLRAQPESVTPPSPVASAAPPPRKLVPSAAPPTQTSQAPSAPVAQSPAAPTQEALLRPSLSGAGQPPLSDTTPPPRLPVVPPEVSPPSLPQGAALCDIPPFNGVQTGAGAYATIRVANTGHRCGVSMATSSFFGGRSGGVRASGDQPGAVFSSLSLSKPPSHGSVTVEGSAFYYTPFPGYTGRDEFAIVTSPSGSVRAAVTVVAPETQPPPPAAAGQPQREPSRPSANHAMSPQTSQAARATKSPAAQPTQQALVRPPPDNAGRQPAPAAPEPPTAQVPLAPSNTARACKIPYFTGFDTAAGGYETIRVVNTGAARCRTTVRNRTQPTEYTLTVSKAPSHGSITIEGNSFYYTPTPGYAGSDEFAIVSSPWGSIKAVVTVLPPGSEL